MVSELPSLSVLQNEYKREVDLESIGLTMKDIFKGLGNGFNEWSTIMA